MPTVAGGCRGEGEAGSAVEGTGHTGGRGQKADGRGACARTNPPAVQLEGERRGEAGNAAGEGRKGSMSAIRQYGLPGAWAPPLLN